MDQWIGRSLQTPARADAAAGALRRRRAAAGGIGIYGVLAFGVAQRVREFGIRQALGADRGDILSHGAASRALRTAAVGVALGLAGAVALTRFLQSQLFGVGARDLTVSPSSPSLLLAAALVACYLPARGTTRIDPIVALRDS